MAKKNIFQKISDALSGNKEEEKAREEAQRVAEAQRQAAKAASDAQAKAAAEAGARVREVEAAAKAAERQAEVQAENAERVAKAEQYRMESEARKAAYAAEKAAAEAVKPKILATHTVTNDDPLSHIALRYYGHATPPYYKHIYEFNKDIIGGNMNIIRAGQVLQIPELPEELQKPE